MPIRGMRIVNGILTEFNEILHGYQLLIDSKSLASRVNVWRCEYTNMLVDSRSYRGGNILHGGSLALSPCYMNNFGIAATIINIIFLANFIPISLEEYSSYFKRLLNRMSRDRH